MPIVAGGANNQLATPADGDRIHARGILYAPDYVINAGGIINVSTEYLKDGDEETVRARIEAIPGRLEAIWAESEATGRNPARVAGDMARRADRPGLRTVPRLSQRLPVRASLALHKPRLHRQRTCTSTRIRPVFSKSRDR